MIRIFYTVLVMWKIDITMKPIGRVSYGFINSGREIVSISSESTVTIYVRTWANHPYITSIPFVSQLFSLLPYQINVNFHLQLRCLKIQLAMCEYICMYFRKYKQNTVTYMSNNTFANSQWLNSFFVSFHLLISDPMAILDLFNSRLWTAFVRWFWF